MKTKETSHYSKKIEVDPLKLQHQRLFWSMLDASILTPGDKVKQRTIAAYTLSIRHTINTLSRIKKEDAEIGYFHQGIIQEIERLKKLLK